MPSARFPNTAPLFEPERMVMNFVAILGDQQIPCQITWEALSDRFGADPVAGHMRETEARAVFKKHRHAINLIADRLITNSRFDEFGKICIESNDC